MDDMAIILNGKCSFAENFAVELFQNNNLLLNCSSYSVPNCQVYSDLLLWLWWGLLEVGSCSIYTASIGKAYIAS